MCLAHESRSCREPGEMGHPRAILLIGSDTPSSLVYLIFADRADFAGSCIEKEKAGAIGSANPS
jgi:hypothetical protein